AEAGFELAEILDIKRKEQAGGEPKQRGEQRARPYPAYPDGAVIYRKAVEQRKGQYGEPHQRWPAHEKGELFAEERDGGEADDDGNGSDQRQRDDHESRAQNGDGEGRRGGNEEIAPHLVVIGGGGRVDERVDPARTAPERYGDGNGQPHAKPGLGLAEKRIELPDDYRERDVGHKQREAFDLIEKKTAV